MTRLRTTSKFINMLVTWKESRNVGT